MKKGLIKTSSIMFIFLIWLIIYEVVSHPLLVPSFSQVLHAWIEMLSHKIYITSFASSFFRLFVSIFFSSLFGICLGILAARFSNVETWIKPYVTILKTVPIISIIIILYILFGYVYAPYIIVFLMVFPLFYQATYQGILGIDQSYLDVFHLETDELGLSVKHVYLPFIRDHVILALYQSFGLGFKVLVTSEFITQTTTSIGNLLYQAKTNLRYDLVFSITIVMILITVAFEVILKYYKHKHDI
jgi:NitT/TauT family transport system permease protein